MRSYALLDGSLLRYHDLPGSGAPLVFLHGLGCASSCDYPGVAAEAALRGRRMLLLDLLGYGFSDRPEPFGYGVEDHAAALAAFLDGLALGPVDLYGHSMGGSIAIALAAGHPRLVARLVVSEPNLEPGGGLFSGPIAHQAEADYLARGHAETVRRTREQGDLAWSGSLAVASALAVHRGASSLVRGSSPSWLAQLAGLSVPRTALVGARSLPDPDVEKLARAGVPVRVVPDAGHSMAGDNPAGLAEALAGALP
jgi:pimeloyl-ACP methyl ester carboxylesterase